MFNIRKWIWGDSIVSNVVFEESLFVTGNNSIYSVKHRTVRGAYKYSPSVGFSAFPYQPHRGKRHPVFKKTISSLSLLFGEFSLCIMAAILVIHETILTRSPLDTLKTTMTLFIF